MRLETGGRRLEVRPADPPDRGPAGQLAGQPAGRTSGLQPSASSLSPAVRVRFAPSPSGYLHVGGARTALFNWLHARHCGGTFVLRVEDTDAKRSSLESVQAIIDAMRWLGLDWDEGPDVGGPCGPYFQSERHALYAEAARTLEDKGLAYRCYCTDVEMAARREEQQKRGEPIRYEGTCKTRTEADKRRREAEGVQPALRFGIAQETVIVPDAIKGDVAFDAALYGDLVIVRGGGQAMYNFACVVDDHAMRISHVIRGDEHLANTPKQMLLYRALGLPQPVFAHLPMILGKDREKLSKRHGHTSVGEYKDQGYLPDGMVNYLTLLGWSAQHHETAERPAHAAGKAGPGPGAGKPGSPDHKPESDEVFSRAQIIERFDVAHVVRNPAIFDGTKLNWLNQQHLKRLLPQTLEALLAPFFEKAFGRLYASSADPSPTMHSSLVALIRDTLVVLSDVAKEARVFYEPLAIDPTALAEVKARPTARSLVAALIEELGGVGGGGGGGGPGDFTKESCKAALVRAGQRAGAKGKDLFHTARVAMTGQPHGHDLTGMIAIMGREKVLANLRTTAEMTKENRGEPFQDPLPFGGGGGGEPARSRDLATRPRRTSRGRC